MNEHWREALDGWDHSGNTLLLFLDEKVALLRNRFETLVANKTGDLNSLNYDLLHFVDMLNAFACHGRDEKHPNADAVLEFKAVFKYEFEVGLQKAAEVGKAIA